MKMFKNLQLRTKLYFAFGVILTLVCAFFFVSNFTMKNITNKYNEILDVHYKNIRDAEKLKTTMLALRKNEKDFLLTRDKKFTELHSENYTKLEIIVSGLKENLPASIQPTIGSIVENVETYNGGVKEIVSYNDKEGDSKTGLRGDLRSTSHKIEEFIKNNNLKDSYMVALLTFRRREKDFLLRRDAKYLSKLRGDIKKVFNSLDESNFSKADELKSLINTYETKFEVLVNNEKELAGVIEKFEKNVLEVEKLTEELMNQSQTYLLGEKEAINEEIKLSNTIFVGIGIFIASIIFGIAVFARKILNKLNDNVESLKKASVSFQGISGVITDSSVQLSDLTTSQSSSIQETASSVNEITAMVSKNNQSAQNSQVKSEENSRSAKRGKQTVEDVIKAMNTLMDSSNRMNARFEQTSAELEDVVQIINQIGEKTKVINDIVFQTKLLSFNASVEAARAGEHGKGFAVVAEEVGNLASMSGTSAEEITKILDESINKVTSLVEGNKTDMSEMISQNDSNVNKGIQTAKECEKVLNNIIGNINDINNSISEIAHASKEQDAGVKEISLAINNLNDSNHRVTRLAGKSKQQVNSMNDGVQSVLEVALSIEKMVKGKNEELAQEAETSDDEIIENTDFNQAA